MLQVQACCLGTYWRSRRKKLNVNWCALVAVIFSSQWTPRARAILRQNTSFSFYHSSNVSYRKLFLSSCLTWFYMSRAHGLNCKTKTFFMNQAFLFLVFPQLSKQEKQQQRKEKTRPKGPSESSREKGAQRSRQDPNASSGAEGDVSSEREP